MTCSRCSAAIVTSEQFDRGLCATCITTSSLSALVALAAAPQPFMAPIYFGNHQRSDREWKADQFSKSTPEVM